jgi:hypothetical protein
MDDDTGFPADPVCRDYLVHGPNLDVTVTEIAQIIVGDRAELMLRDADGVCAAVFAPGQWWHARVTDDAGADDD